MPPGSLHSISCERPSTRDPSGNGPGLAPNLYIMKIVEVLGRSVRDPRPMHPAIGGTAVPPEVRVITDQVLVLGLDGLYREAMKAQESDALLDCARAVARRLRVSPATGPVEGYYTETPELTEYFQTMRALQECRSERRDILEDSRAFHRLEEVTSSPLFGVSCGRGDSLLPRACDPLFFALESAAPETYSVAGLAESARRFAVDLEDASLVGLAACTGDPVLIAALRETVVLYAADYSWGIDDQPEVAYRWAVSDPVLERVSGFVTEFNALFAEHLPLPRPEGAPFYWDAYEENDPHGRCVRIAVDPRRPDGNYHWGVYRVPDGSLAVEEFWSDRLWTTSYYSGHQVFPVHDGSGIGTA